MVDGISNIGSNIDSLLQSVNQTAKRKNAGTETTKTSDTVSLGMEGRAPAVTYSSAAAITGNSPDDGITDLKDLVYRLLSRQGITWEAAMAGEPVEIDEETRAEAKALIADDGYWGIDQTSTRIVEMAIANAGGDMEKVDQIKAAIDKGFEMAKDALGGTLPDISLGTYDAVMEKLDTWAGLKDA